jgi:hypothetical protein
MTQAEERQMWRDAYCAAFMTPGCSHDAAGYADEAVGKYRRRFGTASPERDRGMAHPGRTTSEPDPGSTPEEAEAKGLEA